MKITNTLSHMKNIKTYNMRSFVILFLMIGFLSCESNSVSELALPEDVVGETPVDPVTPEDPVDPVDPVTPVDPVDPLTTYNGSAKAIFDGNCVECHNAGEPTSGVALDTYNSAIRFAQAGLSRMMNGQRPMPPAGRISADLIANIESWINDGLLEN